MIGKCSNKNKFVDRGIYFILKGEYQGSFILNVKELDTPTEKTFMTFPDQEIIRISREQVKQLFNDKYFDYVKTIPKRVYSVCVAQIKGKV